MLHLHIPQLQSAQCQILVDTCGVGGSNTTIFIAVTQKHSPVTSLSSGMPRHPACAVRVVSMTHALGSNHKRQQEQPRTSISACMLPILQHVNMYGSTSDLMLTQICVGVELRSQLDVLWLIEKVGPKRKAAVDVVLCNAVICGPARQH